MCRYGTLAPRVRTDQARGVRLSILSGLLVLACGACGAAPEGDDEPKACGLVLTPDARLAAVTASWATQWSEATGCEVTVGEGGVPVLDRDEALGSDGLPTCGATERVQTPEGEHLRTVAITIAKYPPARCAPWGAVLGHEIGHALGGTSEHADDPDSLLAEQTKTGKVHTCDAEAVAVVCAAIDCPRIKTPSL